MQLVPQRVQDARQVPIAANVREAGSHGLVPVRKVLAPLLQVCGDVLALRVDVDDLFVDGIGQEL